MNFAPSEADDDVALTHDTLFAGALRLTQPAKGHRAGTDAVLLAASAPRTCGLVIDVGAGVGTVGLTVAMRNPDVRVTLLERDPTLATLARRNAQANSLADRIDIAETNILAALPRRNAGVKNESAMLVLTNPPFYSAGTGRESRERLKRDAHVLDGTLADWLTACVALLMPGGIFATIHRPDALPDMLSTLRGRLGGMIARPIHSRENEPASRIVLTGIKGSRAPFVIEPGRALHEPGGRVTSWSAALHAGEILALD